MAISAKFIVSLCVASILLPQSVNAAVVINGPERTGGSAQGNPPIPRGTVRFPNRPKVPGGAFTLFCPSDTRSETVEVKTAVTWVQSNTAEVGANAGVGWGPIQAGINAKLTTSSGVTIGQEVTKTVTLAYGPDPWRSFDYCIWPAYGKFRFWGTDDNGKAFEVFVYVLEGSWAQRDARPDDKCPCKEVADARSDLDDYRSSLPPGNLRDLIDTALVSLDGALASDLGSLSAELQPVGQKLIAAVLDEGGDEPTLDGVLALAASTLDMATEQILAFVEGTDSSVGGAVSTHSLGVDLVNADLALAELTAARLTVADVGEGIARFDQGIIEYGQAVGFAITAQSELFNVTGQECIQGTGTGSEPAKACDRVPATDSRAATILVILLACAILLARNRLRSDPAA